MGLNEKEMKLLARIYESTAQKSVASDGVMPPEYEAESKKLLEALEDKGLISFVSKDEEDKKKLIRMTT